MPDYSIRIRHFPTPTTKGRVLPAHDATFTNVTSDAAVLTFKIARDVAGDLAQPFYIGVEARGASGWFTPNDDLFIAYEDDSEDNDAGRFVTFTGVSWVNDRVATHFMGSEGVVDREREWKAVSAGKVLVDLLAQHPGIGVQRSFTADQDSLGKPWPAEDISDQKFRELSSVGSVLTSLTRGLFCEWHTRGTELVLKVAGTGANRADGAAPIKIGPGATSVKVRSSVQDTATDFIIVSDQEDVPRQYATRPEIGAGRRQAIVTVAGATTAEAAMRMAEPIINSLATVRREVTVIYDAGALPARPYEDFQLGDLLRVRSRGTWEARRIIGIQITQTEAKTSVRLTFGERFLSLDAKLAGRMTQITLGSVSGAGGNGGVIPPVVAPVTGEPLAPSAIAVIGNVAEFEADGSANATVDLDWPSIGQTVDGVNTTVTQYDVWMRREDGPATLLTTTTESHVSIDLPAGAKRYVQVRAFNGRWSEFSPETAIVAAEPPMELEAPSKPTLVARAGVVAASWDGKLGSAVPGRGFQRVVAEHRVGTGAWTPASTYATSAGQVATITAAPGSSVSVRLFALDTRGRLSAASAVQSITVPGIRNNDLDSEIADAISQANEQSEQAVTDASWARAEVGKAISTSLDEYVVSASSTFPPGPTAAWSPDTPDWRPGQYVWRRTKNTHIDGSVSYSAPSVITGADGTPGEDAVLLRVASTRGTSFKNNAIATVLTATVFKGSRQITTITDLWAEFGTSAYLEWWWRRIDDSDFGVISSADDRLSQSGFALTVSPDDVDEQTVFQCILHT